MDYLGYFKLALKESGFGEFPEMSSGEFDRRCTLKTIPLALKECWMALGAQRVCLMHRILTPPEEFAIENNTVRIVCDASLEFRIDETTLGEENPLVLFPQIPQEEIKPETAPVCKHNGETRLALALANLIRISAEETFVRMDLPCRGLPNRIRYALTFSRTTERLLNTAAGVLFAAALYNTHPDSLFLHAVFAITGGWLGVALMRTVIYSDIRLDRHDNVTLVRKDDSTVRLILETVYAYVCLNHPDIWLRSDGTAAVLTPSIALRKGIFRYSQIRYDIISDQDGELTFPDCPAVPYLANQPCTILLRATFDECGCLRFTHVLPGRRRTQPKPRKIKLKKQNPA